MVVSLKFVAVCKLLAYTVLEFCLHLMLLLSSPNILGIVESPQADWGSVAFTVAYPENRNNLVEVFPVFLNSRHHFVLKLLYLKDGLGHYDWRKIEKPDYFFAQDRNIQALLMAKNKCCNRSDFSQNLSSVTGKILIIDNNRLLALQ